MRTAHVPDMASPTRDTWGSIGFKAQSGKVTVGRMIVFGGSYDLNNFAAAWTAVLRKMVA